ncbi:indole-3-glycerol phosphate synthase TrpC [Gorillibacterium timonense]|uniref:indole-3-glycerol phosphate synthase TrpC n=1 Tax=Gorillibacterium timonense TaxID=1689269 RepID=UPI00071CEE5F|nr:indole-3-glycerol phosphate synthase TrpC [Gorillibacterium timonense]
MFLERIRKTKETEVSELSERFDLGEAERSIRDLPPCRGFEKALSENRKRPMGLIAEVKKASPSKGLIRADFDPAAIAGAYEAAGADCISVLTDRNYFQGGNDYLRAVRGTVQVPILRKDFIIAPVQIFEARLIGADAILLIAAMLTSEELESFLRLSRELGLDALVEIHNREELERVLELESAPKLIGINNRNLHTFETDLRTTGELAALIPTGRVIVSESGISGPDDIHRLHKDGAQAVLVGEHFMRQVDISQAVQDLLGPVKEVERI